MTIADTDAIHYVWYTRSIGFFNLNRAATAELLFGLVDAKYFPSRVVLKDIM